MHFLQLSISDSEFGSKDLPSKKNKVPRRPADQDILYLRLRAAGEPAVIPEDSPVGRSSEIPPYSVGITITISEWLAEVSASWNYDCYSLKAPSVFQFVSQPLAKEVRLIRRFILQNIGGKIVTGQLYWG